MNTQSTSADVIATSFCDVLVFHSVSLDSSKKWYVPLVHSSCIEYCFELERYNFKQWPNFSVFRKWQIAPDQNKMADCYDPFLAKTLIWYCCLQSLAWQHSDCIQINNLSLLERNIEQHCHAALKAVYSLCIFIPFQRLSFPGLKYDSSKEAWMTVYFLVLSAFPLYLQYMHTHVLVWLKVYNQSPQHHATCSIYHLLCTILLVTVIFLLIFLFKF